MDFENRHGGGIQSFVISTKRVVFRNKINAVSKSVETVNLHNSKHSICHEMQNAKCTTLGISVLPTYTKWYVPLRFKLKLQGQVISEISRR